MRGGGGGGRCVGGCRYVGFGEGVGRYVGGGGRYVGEGGSFWGAG